MIKKKKKKGKKPTFTGHLLSSRYHFRCFNMNKSILIIETFEVGSVIIFILQMNQQRHKERRKLVQGHRASQQPSQIGTQAVRCWNTPSQAHVILPSPWKTRPRVRMS